ncbi:MULTISPECIES: UbiX family flavin prenyltransferase [unclassified Rathayibacter]|jgi:4-hydroxy-3-polyprenylbenzoate decarboxylase|uniref:UbiX family flavin prenyltransferase n=1 Tax=unclassified Rathayibacter TaxID=2609250 RepID=UPI000CE8974D|nr:MULTISPECIES: UbiX family flavin prenyltransferase [unclassified Rathayibacter]PPG51546.1 3-octaprenyl-4-hydroxybenzoate carboxy-lyase [Rathayibacter sp. AY2B3]PPI22737.1 3-octaprenyl-4-hydroxybenzoate carboxy-lyase [Rathayibacter sp. AY1B6]PPI26367.1 3-octaprenyl-4-hydroxybenzoate carboxy-lyase [Rathayibacter sp. AY1B5]PPI38226.1 3-octaprenyl-4-hydroxybenzoate carboxy-lyase [Rathayibacter sp. AY1B1]
MNRTRQEPPGRVIVAITGASGVGIGVRILELLRMDPGLRSDVIVSKAGAMTLDQECGLTQKQVEALADTAHRPAHIGASIASGSTPATAMVIAPCTIKTLSGIAYGLADNLITRAADVCLKEGVPTLLMVRESPLHRGHLAAMDAVARSGGIIAPPVPAFYTRPASVEEIIDSLARRALVRVGLTQFHARSWAGIPEDGARTEIAEGSSR